MFLNCREQWKILVINTRNGWAGSSSPHRKSVKAWKAKGAGHGEGKRGLEGVRRVCSLWGSLESSHLSCTRHV